MARKHRNRACVRSEALVDLLTNRVLATYRVTRGGRVEVRGGKGLTGAERERAAAWLEDVLPELSHDSRYALLFG